MSDKPLYPEGVEVHQTQLGFESISREFHIQRKSVDLARSGIVSGLRISIGSPDSRFNISAGYAHTPRGDYVEYSGGSNIALADYTVGTENLFVLVYRDVPTTPEAHEDGGSTRATLLQRSSILKVITRTEYNALPASTDPDLATDLRTTNYNVDAQNRMVIVASVFAQGLSYHFVSGDLVDPSKVQQQSLPVTILTAGQGTHYITGINFKSVSTGTTLGNGYLQLNGSVGAWKLSWISPDDTTVRATGTSSAGALSSPTGHNFGSSSLPIQFDLLSESGLSTITVEVMTGLLPLSGEPILDSIKISSFYDDVGGHYSASDILHREKIGSYVPTKTDPHGTGYADLAQNVAIIPSPMVLGSDFIASTAAALVARLTTPRANSGRTQIWQSPGGTAGTIHIYVSSTATFELTINAYFDGTNWNRDDNSSYAYLWRFDGGLTEFQKTPGSSPWADSAWDNLSMPINGIIKLGELLRGTTSNLILPRITANRGTGNSGYRRTCLFQSVGNGGTGNDLPLSLWLSSSSPDGNHPSIELVVNALWDGSTYWVQQVTNVAMTRFAVSHRGIRVMSTVPTATTATDDLTGSGWTLDRFRVDTDGNNVIGGNLIATQSFTATNSVRAGDGLISAVASPRFVAAASTARTLITQTDTGSYNYRKYAGVVSGSLVTEETYGCAWDPNILSGAGGWIADSNTAVLYRFTENAMTSFKKTGLSNGSQWLDTNWDTLAVPAFRLGLDGNPTTFSSDVDIGSSDFLGKNAIRSYGEIILTHGASPTFIFGHNFTAALDTTFTNQCNLRISFAKPFTSLSYYWYFSNQQPTVNGDDFGRFLVRDQTLSYIVLRVLKQNGSQTGVSAINGDPDQFDNGPFHLNFTFIGQ